MREYASLFKVNPNTMQKALIELENLSLIYTERTNGKFVTIDEALITKFKKNYAKDIIKNYLTDMNNIGIKKEEAIKYIIEKSEDYE